MEYVNCDQCNSNELKTVAHQKDVIHNTSNELFSVVRCLKCNLHFTNPRPNKDEIGKYYSSDYGFHSTTGFILTLKGSYLINIRDWMANSKLASLFSFVPILSRILAKSVKPKIADPVLSYVDKNVKKSFLDIGCGSGRTAHFWGASGSLMKYKKYFHVFGVEPNLDSQLYLDSAGIKCWANINMIEKKYKFDLIRMNWSLEHVHSPKDYFNFISEHLNENGTAFIMVPNNEGLLYKMNQNCLELPIHLYHFSLRDIENYAHKAELFIDDSVTFSYPEMYQVAASNGLLSSKFRFAENISKAQKAMSFLEAVDEMGWGTDMIISLKKQM